MIEQGEQPRAFRLIDRGDVFPAERCREMFEKLVRDSDKIAAYGLDRAADGEYVSSRTQEAFVFFGLGLRCAERMENAVRNVEPDRQLWRSIFDYDYR